MKASIYAIVAAATLVVALAGCRDDGAVNSSFPTDPGGDPSDAVADSPTEGAASDSDVPPDRTRDVSADPLPVDDLGDEPDQPLRPDGQDARPDSVAPDAPAPDAPGPDVPEPVYDTAFGIFYNTWHCPASSDGGTVHDISEILAGRQAWGPVGAFHWWDQPEQGYYCLARNDGLLERHAIQLRDAGIDFVFLDATNHAYVDGRSDRTSQMIIEPVDRLLAVWSEVPGAPGVVPWVPIVEPGVDAGAFTIDALLARLVAYPGMHFELFGEPLILVVDHGGFPPNEARIAALEASYTVRRMWGLLPAGGTNWSFLQPCNDPPTSGRDCNQRVTSRDGSVEQVSISVAYQQTFMNNTATATPKHAGRTFRAQFETLIRNAGAPVATITGWNEWIAQRQPCDGHPSCPCSTFPDGCFTDQWDIEFSRDIEPAQNEAGDYYLRLLTECVSMYRAGDTCASAPSNLCCIDHSF